MVAEFSTFNVCMQIAECMQIKGNHTYMNKLGLYTADEFNHIIGKEYTTYISSLSKPTAQEHH